MNQEKNGDSTKVQLLNPIPRREVSGKGKIDGPSVGAWGRGEGRGNAEEEGKIDYTKERRNQDQETAITTKKGKSCGEQEFRGRITPSKTDMRVAGNGGDVKQSDQISNR